MKIGSIQLLRAIAAWMVVFHHYMQLVHGSEHTTFWGKWFREHGEFGVDLFFVISGFVMYFTVSQRDYSVRSFLIGRFARIAPAYWVATLVLLAATSVYGESFALTDWSPESLVSSLLFIPSENPSGVGVFPFLTVGWTLNIEMFFYGTLGFCLLLGKPWRFPVCGALIVVTPFVWQLDWPYGSVLSDKRLLEFVFGLVIGHAYLRCSRPRDWAQQRPISALLLLAGSIVVLYVNTRGARAFGACGIVLTGLCVERFLVRDRSWLSMVSAHLGIFPIRPICSTRSSFPSRCTILAGRRIFLATWRSYVSAR